MGDGHYIDTLHERDAARAEAARLRAERDAMVARCVIQLVPPGRFFPGGRWFLVTEAEWYDTRAEAVAEFRASAGLDPEGD